MLELHMYPVDMHTMCLYHDACFLIVLVRVPDSTCKLDEVIAGWEEERSGPTGKSFRFVRACLRAVIVKWK